MRVEQHVDSGLRRRRSGVARPLTPSLFLLAAISCGGRTSVSDLEFLGGQGDDGAGASSSGTDARTGSNSGGGTGPVGVGGGTPLGGAGGRISESTGGNVAGGAGGHLIGGTGGVLSGGSAGASTGGGSATGGASTGGHGGNSEPNCPFGTWLNGAHCEPWTQCQPGEYVEYFGSRKLNRECAPCPPGSYSTIEDAGSCHYNGCEFSEIVVTPGSSTEPAECAPRPGFFPLDPGESSLIGFASSGTRVYAALASPTEATFHGFEGEVALTPLRYSIEGQQAPGAFAMAPDGKFYLTGPDPVIASRIWLDTIASDALSATRMVISNASSYGQVGLLSTPSHWIHWTTEYEDSTAHVVLRAGSHSHVMAGEARIPASNFSQLSASSAERIFLLLSDTTQELHRLLGLTPPTEKVAFPGSFFPIFSTAVPTGEAYAIGARWADEHTVEAYKVEPDGSVTEHFQYRFEQAVPSPAAAAVDPGRALYVLCHMWPDSGFSSEFARESLYLLRFDLVTGESTPLNLEGGADEWAIDLEVTSDGSVYAAGVTGTSYFVRKVY